MKFLGYKLDASDSIIMADSIILIIGIVTGAMIYLVMIFEGSGPLNLVASGLSFTALIMLCLWFIKTGNVIIATPLSTGFINLDVSILHYFQEKDSPEIKSIGSFVYFVNTLGMPILLSLVIFAIANFF